MVDKIKKKKTSTAAEAMKKAHGLQGRALHALASMCDEAASGKVTGAQVYYALLAMLSSNCAYAENEEHAKAYAYFQLACDKAHMKAKGEER